jgi:hypothetical protein
MTCGFITGCGSSDSSSSESNAESSAVATEESSTAEVDTDTTDSAATDGSADSDSNENTATSSEADTSDTTATSSEKSDDTSESTATDTGAKGELTEAYTAQLADKKFSIDMTMESDYFGEVPLVIECYDSNMHINMSAYGSDTDMYLVDGMLYYLDGSTQSYETYDASDSGISIEDLGVDTFGLDDSYVFVGSEETDDGYICESYNINFDWSELGIDSLTDSEAEEYKSEAKYYFDKDTKELKKIVVVSMGIEETVTINSYTTDIKKIALPDLSDWSLVEEETGDDDLLDLDSLVDDEL